MSTRRHPTRRTFLAHTTTAAATSGFVPYFPWTATAFANQAANDRPGIGCIGLGGAGMFDAIQHAQFGDIRAVCDVDKDRAQRAKFDVRIGNGKALAYGDYRKVLERPDIDVVSIVTTDHWHVKIAVEALQAGKHVFCQKPLSLTLEENQLARAAAEKFPQLQFFIGTQQRGEKDTFCRAVNMVHKGLLGEIKKVTAGIGGSPIGGPFPIENPPQSARLGHVAWPGAGRALPQPPLPR
jgi:predicted dehydrogenase